MVTDGIDMYAELATMPVPTKINPVINEENCPIAASALRRDSGAERVGLCEVRANARDS